MSKRRNRDQKRRQAQKKVRVQEQTPEILPTIIAVANQPATAAILIGALISGLWLSPTHMYEDGIFFLRYAKNLVDGHGLVYNPGEYYEGNTSFLWTIFLVPTFLLGIEPVFYLRALGALIAAGVLTLVYLIVVRTDSRCAGLVAVALLGTNFSFMVMSVSGFAQHFQSFFALLTLLMILRFRENANTANGTAIGICLTALLLTRLDSTTFAVILLSIALYGAWRDRPRRWLSLALIGGLPAVLFAVFLAWKLQYYGDILPATYYIKAGPQVPDAYNFFTRGVAYIWYYLLEYWFLYLLPVFAYGAYCRLKAPAGEENKKESVMTRISALTSQNLVTFACTGMASAWFLYMLRIGGDSEFRLITAATPFLFILIVRTLWGLKSGWQIPVAMLTAAALIFASFYHQHTFTGSGHPGVGTPSTARFLVLSHTDQQQDIFIKDSKKAGIALGKLLAASGDYPAFAKIATTAGGYLPFFSRLHTLEMHGFTDTRILLPGNHTVSPSPLPGHSFIVTPSFLLSQGINLVFGHPLVLPENVNILERFGIGQLVGHLLRINAQSQGFSSYPRNIQIVEIPIGAGKKIIALYLTRNRELDGIFRQHNVAVHDLVVSLTGGIY